MKDEEERCNLYFYINIISISLLIILIAFRLVYSPASVVGVSMDNTLHDGDIVAFSSLAKTFGISRGDIVAVKARKTNMVKRVIGLPNERVTILDGMVFINDKLLVEHYLDDVRTEGHIDMKLGEDEYFVMGDNRPNSMDSRDPKIGPIKKKNIIGIIMPKQNFIKQPTKTKDIPIEIPDGFFRPRTELK